MQELKNAYVVMFWKNLDVLPSNIDLSAAEIELIGIENKEYLLKNEVDKIKTTMILL